MEAPSNPGRFNPPAGCHFNPRCRYAVDLRRTDAPPLEDVGGGHYVACHRARELSLRGVPDLDDLIAQ